jgi:hypothetical protein
MLAIQVMGCGGYVTFPQKCQNLQLGSRFSFTALYEVESENVIVPIASSTCI